MEESSFFMQWALNTLDQNQLPSSSSAAPPPPPPYDGGDTFAAAAASFPSLHALRQSGRGGRNCLQVDVHRPAAASSWSGGASSDDSPAAAAAMDHDASPATAAGWSPHTARARTSGGRGGRQMSWNFGAASAQPTADIIISPPPPAPAASAAPARSGGRQAASSSPGPVQDHIIAERRRREKINQRFIELSTVIPGLKKMDKATILGDAVKYVRELQDKVKTLEDEDDKQQHTSTTIQYSAMLVNKKKTCLASLAASSDEAGGESSESQNGSGLPEIEVRLSEKSVLVRIHCESAKGMLVRVLAEVESLRLAITHTSVMPFPAATAIITITAKVEEGFNSTVEEIVRKLNSALHRHYTGNGEC